MPYLWTDPDVVLSHNEVDVYYIYRDDLAENPPREHHFGFDISCTDARDEGAFDLRDVVSLLPAATRAACADDTVALLTALIDAGFLTSEGFNIDGELHDNAASIRAAVKGGGA